LVVKNSPVSSSRYLRKTFEFSVMIPELMDGVKNNFIGFSIEPSCFSFKQPLNKNRKYRQLS